MPAFKRELYEGNATATVPPKTAPAIAQRIPFATRRAVANFETVVKFITPSLVPEKILLPVLIKIVHFCLGK